jgi:hypothetical protein
MDFFCGLSKFFVIHIGVQIWDLLSLPKRQFVVHNPSKKQYYRTQDKTVEHKLCHVESDTGVSYNHKFSVCVYVMFE